MPPLRIHFAGNPQWAEVFRTELGNFAKCEFGLEAAPDTEILVKGRPSAEELGLPNLRAVIVPFAGIPTETRELLASRPDLQLFNLHHNAADAAEMAIALYLAIAKRVVVRDRGMREGRWSEDSFVRGGSSESVRAAGKRALVLGYGAIGKRIVRICEAMEMRVTAINRSGPFDQTLKPIDQLDEVLAESNALFVALPLSPSTTNLLDSRRIGLLPNGCLISNIARGAIFNEAALYEALRDKRIAGAGLDVWWNYPKADEPCFPSQYPFHELSNVVMTPHVGGSSDASEEHRWRALADLIRQIADGTATPASAELGY